MTDQPMSPADMRPETPPRSPGGCPPSDVVAVVLRLLVESGHSVDGTAVFLEPVRTAAANLLLAFGVCPSMNSRIRLISTPGDRDLSVPYDANDAHRGSS